MNFAEMTSVGVVVLRKKQIDPPPSRIEGTLIRPNDPKLIQDIAWVFPEIAAGNINVVTLRNRIQWQWHWLIGVACYRAFSSQLTLDENWNRNAQNIVVEEIAPLIDQVFELLLSEEELTALKTVAGLDRQVDKFGPRNSAFAYSIAWGLKQEWILSTMIQDKSIMTPQDQLRYSSWEEFVKTEYADSHEDGDVLNVLNFYVANAWDMVATMRGTETLEQTISALEAQQAWENLKGGAITAINLYSNIQHSRNQGALAKFRRERARQIRNQNSWW